MLLTELCVIFSVVLKKILAQDGMKDPHLKRLEASSRYAALRAKFTYQYDPNLGLEPYWMGGDKKIEDPVVAYQRSTRAVKRTTVTIPVVCGNNCIEQYQSIKEVCAHYTKNIDQNEMIPWPYPDYNRQFKDPLFIEFKTYCAYLDTVCRVKRGEESYVLLHIGKCKTIDGYFKPVMDPKSFVNRLTSYPLYEGWSRTTTVPTGPPVEN